MGSLNSWDAVQSSEETEEYVYLMLDTVVGHIIPKRDLSKEQLNELMSTLSENVKNHSSVSTLSDVGPQFDFNFRLNIRSKLRSTFLRNLIGGTRFALLQRVNTEEFEFGLRQVVAFLSLGVVIIICNDYLNAIPNATFNVYGITDLATSYLLFFVGIYLIARLLESTFSMQTFLLVLLTTSPIVLVVYLAIAFYTESYQARWSLRFFYVVWECIIVFRAIKLVFKADRHKAAGLTIMYALVVLTSAFYLPNQRLWYSYDASEYEQYADINSENTYYRQRELIDSINLLDDRVGTKDIYFVGFASYADQDVFLKEVRYTKDLFDERFDTRGRSVALINNAKTVYDVPLATTHNLRFVLQKVAQKMNVNEDILFLFLTSHGSRDAKLSARFWPLQPNDLEASELKDILDETGIKWKVVVVSSCYSGSFIAPLKDDFTLLITASSKDKQSFGCSNARDFTYFGEAYFSQALRSTHSWVEGFDVAKDTIEKRELAENKTPSEPQIYVGKKIKQQLIHLRQRLESIE